MCDCCSGDEENAFDPSLQTTEPLMDKDNLFSHVRSSSPSFAFNGGRVESPSNMSEESDAAMSSFGTNYSCSEYERSLRSPTMEDAESLLPTWVNDKEADHCLSCNKPFKSASLFSSIATSSSKIQNKRHHCRRCRNIFCGSCSSRTSVVLLAAGTKKGKSGNKKNTGDELMRVCDKCYEVLPDENEFIYALKPLLLRGENFKKSSSSWGIFSSDIIVRISLTIDGTSLVVEQGGDIRSSNVNNSSSSSSSSSSSTTPDKSSGANGNTNGTREENYLSEISKVVLKKLTVFEITYEDGNTLNLEGADQSLVRQWHRALCIACDRAKLPSLKTRIELERRQLVESQRRAEEESQRNQEHEDIKERRKAERAAMRDKYHPRK